LFELEEGIDIAMSYLKSRGFNEDIIKKFQLGYNPQARDGFTQVAISAQYNQELLIKTGLVANRDERLSDNYRGRIIFPIHNQSGKVLGFGARVIKSNDKSPKYINTPETEIYVKSKVLYGAYFAKGAIDKTNECLLVEGYTDVVSLHQAGIENVVASGGTSLTIEQLRLIKKYTKNLTIIYDGDGAGIKAALRGLDLAVEEGLEVKLVLIPDNEDPDSYVNKIGKEAFIEFVKNEKKDFILFQLEIALKDAKGDSAKKSAVVNQIAETISKINKSEDFTKRQDYIKNVSEILKIEEAGFNALVNNIIRNRITKEEQKSIGINLSETTTETPEEFIHNVDDLLNKDERQEQALVKSLIEFGQKLWDENTSVANYIITALDEMELNTMIENNLLISIIEEYRKANDNGESPNAKYFLYHENETIKNKVINLMEEETEISPNWKDYYQGYIATRDDLYKEEVNSTLNYLQLRKIKKLINENQNELEKTNDPDQQFICLQTHQELKKMEKAITQQTGIVIYK